MLRPATSGPSPRVRGIQCATFRDDDTARSIPAGAGNPHSATPPARASRVHPRGCGESLGRHPTRRRIAGPSPRVRGIQARDPGLCDHNGSIPAGAGNPPTGSSTRPGRWVHPRGCGESMRRARLRFSGWGPSPRVRGIRRPPPAARRRLGSIPAGAGNPGMRSTARIGSRVHPRGCGESILTMCVEHAETGPSPRVRGIHPGGLPSADRWGPSPRVRGIPCNCRRDHLGLGSIPAGAGNPPSPRRTASASRVHPRGCGESVGGANPDVPGFGPSPRVRGIHQQVRRGLDHLRSIPAGAGNPPCHPARSTAFRVHPRGCGESGGGEIGSVGCRGPSPRVRGILQVDRAQAAYRGSIPAGAGNPSCRSILNAAAWVHPRGCGESEHNLTPQAAAHGPSPRVRGIHARAGLLRGLSRSIPAGAGNPSGYETRSMAGKVHPRGCGESASRSASRASSCGPSPRVRGIPGIGRARRGARGSIPAGAGNPATGPARARSGRVHPRGCGESCVAGNGGGGGRGPSPRVRGIRSRRWSRGADAGSIPAGAGNPPPPPRSASAPRVHPRGCGESSAPDLRRAAPRGPSPRVRGIRRCARGAGGGGGSIPAGAGNPQLGSAGLLQPRVHPRGCGESFQALPETEAAGGPSPRVRGILRPGPDGPVCGGSIPAGAGNPAILGMVWAWKGVHPRGCGESGLAGAVETFADGPSPRVRGILVQPRLDAVGPGSIPAGAGNPARRDTS